MVFHDRENKHDFVKTVPGKWWNLCVFSKPSRSHYTGSTVSETHTGWTLFYRYAWSGNAAYFFYPSVSDNRWNTSFLVWEHYLLRMRLDENLRRGPAHRLMIYFSGAIIENSVNSIANQLLGNAVCYVGISTLCECIVHPTRVAIKQQILCVVRATSRENGGTDHLNQLKIFTWINISER